MPTTAITALVTADTKAAMAEDTDSTADIWAVAVAITDPITDPITGVLTTAEEADLGQCLSELVTGNVDLKAADITTLRRTLPVSAVAHLALGQLLSLIRALREVRRQ